jgi:hypothetical protein
VPHQIDIVVKSSTDGIKGVTYIKEVYSFSVHLRSQNNLIIAMGVKCPNKTNRWVHLGRVLIFYKKHRRQIIQHTNENRPEKLPTDEWWVITNAVSPASNEINVTFAKLQSRSVLIVQQEEIVNLLIGTLSSMFGIEVVDPENIGDDEVEYVSIDSMRDVVTNIECHIRDQGSFAGDCFDRLDVDEQKEVVKEIATYAQMLAPGLIPSVTITISLHQDAPPVMPQQLVTLRPAKFIQDVLMPFRDRLKKFWTLEQIEEIEADHRGVHKLYRGDENVRKAIDEHDVNTIFTVAWDCVGRSDRLRTFCGGLATVFPNTTALESDISILKCEMNELRTTLTHLSLEGIFQAKQRVAMKQCWD